MVGSFNRFQESKKTRIRWGSNFQLNLVSGMELQNLEKIRISLTAFTKPSLYVQIQIYK